ncbi:DEAH-box RNA helicase-like protein [Viridothelium virens]|uniref:RNA helicase n=1 Tax=Viridothelium virens TaxID=1048519 RepID=A0A6A6HLH2_VIRVR|nr:DEAH-box RNA helicase-like protein [Viridothelium virens]
MPKFVPRQRKHKARERQKQNGHSTGGDANAVELLPESKDDREKRRNQLQEELRAQQPQSKISAKKQKRLNKYIDTKLRKEENQELIKKLAAQKVDTSLFRSSKKLGRVSESKREALSRALQERNAGIDIEKNNQLLYQTSKVISDASDTSSDEDDGGSNVATFSKKESVKAISPEPSTQPNATGPAFGSGLKRPLALDSLGKPIIKKRRRTQLAPVVIKIESEEEWEGFSDNTNIDGNEDSTSDSLQSYMQEDSDDIGSTEANSAVTSEESEDEFGDKDREEDKAKKERSSAFRAWATKQRNEVLGFQPSLAINDAASATSKPIEFKPRPAESDPLPAELETRASTNEARQAYSVQVSRTPEIQDARMALPVVTEEQKIMEAIHNNDIVVIWGATGSGKTTQVPQFLFEAGYGDPKGPTPGMIGVTQPRRVAAVSMSKRVGDELCDLKSRVSYQIRFDSSVSSKTAIKFMTDGVLLREIANDFALTKYSAVIIDEAHERSVNTDILIGMMSRIVDLRSTMSKEDPKFQPLKLIIMSATLRISDFTENSTLFRKGSPPLVQAEGRQYPVTIHFARRTQRDYVSEAFHKISRGHKRLPPGGMLVFLTGLNEIMDLSRRLKKAFQSSSQREVVGPQIRVSAAEASVETEDVDFGDYQDKGLDDDASEDDLDSVRVDEEEEDQEFDIGETPDGISSVSVLPLYSQLPTTQQLRVFEPPPEGSRLIVLATNVAETSLTIPGIRYVFDCGRSKEKKYDEITGVQSFEVGWISKASASQRTGRAGRTGPGHCYRLYSSAVYERDFEEYKAPELLRTPIEGIVLQLKSMDLQHVVNFPFPTPPDRQSLAKAEKLLTHLGAISDEGKITHTGRELSLYPLSPRFSRILLLGQSYGLTSYTIALVAALAVPDIFIPENQLALSDLDETPARNASPSDSDTETPTIATDADNTTQEREQRRKAYSIAHATLSHQSRTSDALKLLTTLCAYAHTSPSSHIEFCTSHFLREKGLQEASQLRQQLHSLILTNKPALGLGKYEEKLSQPKPKELELLKQITAAGFIDHIAIRADLSPDPPETARKPKRATEVPYLTLFPSHEGPVPPATTTTQDENEAQKLKFVYVHPSSVLARRDVKAMPTYLVYATLQRSSSTVPGKLARVRMHPLTEVSGRQLVALAKGTPLLDWGKPVGRVDALEPVEGKERRECTVVPSLVGRKGTLGWPLPGTRVVQRKEGGRGWVVEKVVG